MDCLLRPSGTGHQTGRAQDRERIDEGPLHETAGILHSYRTFRWMLDLAAPDKSPMGIPARNCHRALKRELGPALTYHIRSLSSSDCVSTVNSSCGGHWCRCLPVRISGAPPAAPGAPSGLWRHPRRADGPGLNFRCGWPEVLSSRAAGVCWLPARRAAPSGCIPPTPHP